MPEHAYYRKSGQVHQVELTLRVLRAEVRIAFILAEVSTNLKLKNVRVKHNDAIDYSAVGS